MRLRNGHRAVVPRLKQFLFESGGWIKVLRFCVLVVWLGQLSWHGSQGKLVAYSDEWYFHCIMVLFMAAMYWPKWRNLGMTSGKPNKDASDLDSERLS